MYGLTVITPPAEEPVSLAKAKAHLRVDHTADDDLINSWIITAREQSETHTGRCWVERGLRLSLSDWPAEEIGGVCGAIGFPVDPVLSVEKLEYYATTGDLTEMEEGDWQEWFDHAPPLIAPAPATVWPTVQTERLGAVRIEFTAGYGGVNDVPEAAKSAILLMLSYWYENRGDGSDPTMLINGLPQTLGIPPGAKRLLDSLSTGAYP